MRVIRREFFNVSRSDVFRIIPIGDIHMGAAACDEDLLRAVVRRIKSDDRAWWIGMGDMCLPLEAEILTKRGFLTYDQLNPGEFVLAFDGKHTVWTPLIGIYLTPEARFIHLKSKSFDITCTEEHGWWVNDNHKDRWTGKRKRQAAPWPRKVDTKNLKQNQKIITAAECLDPGHIAITPNEAALIGWLVTDGCLVVERGRTFRASISQTKEPYRSEIRNRFSNWFTNEYVRRTGTVSEISVFNISVPKLKALFERLGLDFKKLKEQLPSFVTGLPQEARVSMLNAMIEAEGWRERGHWRFSQKPGPVLDAFCILATLCGMRLSLGKFNKNGVKIFAILDYRPLVGVADLKIKKKGIGPAWCPQTAYGSWVTRLDRQITITGNCDFVTLKDPRSNIGALADWVTLDDLVDLAQAERERLLDILRPIASKCLALVCGNHEASIHRHTERDVYSEIVAGIKGAGGFKADDKLAIGFYGWLQLPFYRSETRKQRGTLININLHHGSTAGRLAGSKALNMQRWLWTHNADIALMGHCHDVKIQPEAVEEIDRGGNVTTRTRCGAYTGTFLRTTNADGTATYAERRGYFPLPYGGVEIELRPGQKERRGRIRMIYAY